MLMHVLERLIRFDLYDIILSEGVIREGVYLG